MTSRLLLVRHSQSRPDPARPASQWGLTDLGRARCVPLAERLAAYRPDVIVTSAEPKAIETGALAAARLGLPRQAAAGLHEHLRERAGWLSEQVFMETVAAFFARPDELVFGEETAGQARARFEGAVRGVLAAHPRKTVAIVTHGTVMTLFVAAQAGLAPLPFWKSLGMPAIVALSLPRLELVEVIERVETAE
jgi:broad specificity phosphatase PhoE